jgi:hypothetical protein
MLLEWELYSDPDLATPLTVPALMKHLQIKKILQHVTRNNKIKIDSSLKKRVGTGFEQYPSFRRCSVGAAFY